MHPCSDDPGAGRLLESQFSFCLSWQARIILEKATKVSFKQVDDLASVWCECGELELRHENYDQALRLLRVNTTWGVAEEGRSVWPSQGCSQLMFFLLSLCRRQQRCLPAGLSTLMAQNLCRTVCTSH